MLFSKARRQKLLGQLTATQLRFGGQTIRFNQEATRWLGLWLDSRLNFSSHFSERLKRAKTAEVRIRGLSKTYGLPPALVRRIQIAAVQSVVLYGAELWWKNQKTHQNEIQKLLNRQARSITGMYPSTPVAALMSESGLIPPIFYSIFGSVNMHTASLASRNLYPQKLFFLSHYEQETETRNPKTTRSTTQHGLAMDL